MKTKLYTGVALLALVAGLAMFGPRFNWGSPPEGPCESSREHSVTARWWATPAGRVLVRWRLGPENVGEEWAQSSSWRQTGTARCGDLVTFFARPPSTVRLRCELAVDNQRVEHREPANRPCDMTHRVE